MLEFDQLFCSENKRTLSKMAKCITLPMIRFSQSHDHIHLIIAYVYSQSYLLLYTLCCLFILIKYPNRFFHVAAY